MSTPTPAPGTTHVPDGTDLLVQELREEFAHLVQAPDRRAEATGARRGRRRQVLRRRFSPWWAPQSLVGPSSPFVLGLTLLGGRAVLIT